MTVIDGDGNKTVITRDGGLRETTAEKLATLNPVLARRHPHRWQQQPDQRRCGRRAVDE